MSRRHRSGSRAPRHRRRPAPLVGPRLGEMTTVRHTLVEPPLPRQTLIHVHAGRRSSAGSISPRLGSTPARRVRRRRTRGLGFGRQQSARRCWVEAARADYLRTLEPVPGPGPLYMSEVMAVLRERLPGDADPGERRREFRRLAAPLLALHALPLAARAHERRDGVRRPGRDRRQDRPPGAHGRLLRGRRRLPDERPGARDRGAGARRRALPRRRQRHVRDDPHAPGARVPRPSGRHRPDESRLRRLRVARSASTRRASSGRRSSHRRSSERSRADGPALLHLLVDPEAITPHTTLTAVREGTAARERTETV